MFGRKWEKSNLEDRIIAIDLDGVLGDYPGYFVRWMYEHMTRAEQQAYLERLLQVDGGLEHPALKEALNYNRYRALKDEYRRSGAEKEMPVNEGAKEFLNHWRDEAKIVLITARPAWEYTNCLRDIDYWLRINDLYVDHIINSRDKHVEVLQRFPHMLFMVEDHRYIANLIAQWGYHVFLKNSNYNKGPILPNVHRINHFDQIQLPANGKCWMRKEHQV